MTLFPQRIERVKSAVTSRGAVRVEHGANADYVVDRQGREWVRKQELETGFQCLMAEAFGALFAAEMAIPVPDSAVQIHRNERAWLSGLLHDVTHWDPAKLPFIENLDSLGSMLALDALLLNEDRHRGNILLQSVADESEVLRIWSIDMGNALVGWPTDFLSSRDRIPDPSNLARGIPFARLVDPAMEAAHTAISRTTIREYSQESCDLVHETTVDEYTEVLYSRFRDAASIVSRYLATLKSLP